MVRLGLKPMVAGWKVQTNPLSYIGTQLDGLFLQLWRTTIWIQFKKQIFIKNDWFEMDHRVFCFATRGQSIKGKQY